MVKTGVPFQPGLRSLLEGLEWCLVCFDVGIAINFVMRRAFDRGHRDVALVPRRSSGYPGVGFTDVGVAGATEAIGTAAGGNWLHVGFERTGLMSACGSP